MLARLTRRGRLLALFAAVGVVGWAFSGATTFGQSINLARARTNPTARNNQAVYAQIKAQLRQARQLMKTADRDYGGHRAKATAALRKALKSLSNSTQQNRPPQAAAGQAPGQQKPGQPGQPGQGQAANPLPQATSDAQMRQAAQAINNALGLLASVPANPRTTAAAPLLQQAVAEIQLALNYVQQKQQLNPGLARGVK